MHRLLGFAYLFLLMTPLAGASPQHVRTKLDEVAPYRRFLWVTRWDYKTADDIKKICYNAASARFTDIFFQVRGEGTVFYKSSLEPWAWELTGSDASSVGTNPGWDPLAAAIREGHRWGLRVHAYVNVLPGWAQKTSPPRRSGQLLVKHPSWFMVDSDGDKMGASWYRFLDPALPDVRAHLAALTAELARNYAVDGIHLDYIRYPFEKGEYGFGKPVLKDFREIYSTTPGKNPSAWNRYRCAQVTETMRMISASARKARPGIEISASVVADPDSAAKACQQPEVWLQKGYIDAAVPMAYTDDMDRFFRLAGRFTQNGHAKNTWVGIIADPAKNGHVTEQVLRMARQKVGGVAVFSYSNLFDQHRPNARARAVYDVFVGARKT